MGRVKLKIKRLESISNRQVTYSKRKSGILKKAKELSILCDVDIALLMFSPSGKPTLFQGDHSNIENVVAKFAHLTPQERAKRKVESLEALKKTFKKLDHEVNIQEFLGSSSQTVEDLTNQVKFMQAQLTQVQERLSYWRNPDTVDRIEHLTHMEDSLKESINRIRLHKENLGKCQLLPLECSNQVQIGVALPFMIDGIQGAQTFSWFSNSGNQHVLLSNDQSFLPQKEIKCATDVSLPGYSGFYNTGKQAEIVNTGPSDNMGQGCGALSDTCLKIKLDEQFSYPPYSSSNLPDIKKVKPEMQMNSQENHVVYQVNSNFELPYNNGHHTWVSSSGLCSISTFNENPYHQVN